MEKDPQVPSPVGRGWKLEKNDGREELVIDWMDGKPAPDAVLDLLSCTCRKSCDSATCACIKNGLRCTDMCTLRACTNQTAENDLQNDDDEISDDDDDDDEEEGDDGGDDDMLN